MELGGIRLLQAADPERRHDALEEAAENAAHADIDVHHGQDVVRPVGLDFQA